MEQLNTKQALTDKATALARAGKADNKMEVGEMQNFLVMEQKAKADHCKALAKRTPNQAAMSTLLKVSSY